MRFYRVTMVEEGDGLAQSDVEVATRTRAEDPGAALREARESVKLEHQNVNIGKLWAWSIEQVRV